MSAHTLVLVRAMRSSNFALHHVHVARSRAVVAGRARYDEATMMDGWIVTYTQSYLRIDYFGILRYVYIYRCCEPFITFRVCHCCVVMCSH